MQEGGIMLLLSLRSSSPSLLAQSHLLLVRGSVSPQAAQAPIKALCNVFGRSAPGLFGPDVNGKVGKSVVGVSTFHPKLLPQGVVP